VTLPPTMSDAPYEPDAFSWVANRYPMSSLERDDGLLEELRRFKPHVTLIVGWERRAYRRCARQLRGKSLRVVCMDNQWLRTPKQLLGIAFSSLYLRPYFDAVFLPGARQVAFARRLGFGPDQIFEGFYSADVDTFRKIGSLETPNGSPRNAFVFVGRLSREKGISDLVEAYEDYRRSVLEPWRLLAVGEGPLAPLLDGIPGVERAGFIQPTGMPALLGQVSFLVLPSWFEPWGVAVHEATAAGLGCICTSAVGAADAFVRDGANGRVVPPHSPAQLADALRWAHALQPAERWEASRLSRVLAERFTPERWANTVLTMAHSAPR
jgi:glycosyltransferase involved in cell wall biosynthesis